MLNLEKLSSDELRLGLLLREDISSAEEWMRDTYRAEAPTKIEFFRHFHKKQALKECKKILTGCM